MSKDGTRPKIRMELDFFPIVHDGEKMIGIRDPLGLAENTILVPPHAFYLIALMDGQSSLDQIQDGFAKKFNHTVPLEQISDLVERLDAEGFMHSSRFKVRIMAVEEAFRNAPVRSSALAGQSYPKDREELRVLIHSFFDQAPENESAGEGPLSGIIAPHIDVHRGSALCARANKALKNQSAPHTVLLFGTAHFGEGNAYILANKGFETPFGISRVDAAFADHLIRHCSFDIEKGLLSHRYEHSIEFQVVFLQHLFGADEGPLIVPVLCGNMIDKIPAGLSPETLPQVASFLEAAEGAIQRCKGPVLVVAGADMSHVGPRFGTAEPLTPEFIEKVRAEDIAALKAAADCDAESFFQSVAGIQNRNNICSVTQIYTLLKLLQHTSGTLLSYDMAVDEDNGTAVGFAALNFRK
ncbi:MAG: AmmeMemoRadiSam system protein B [Planctomycetota bacterium]